LAFEVLLNDNLFQNVTKLYAFSDNGPALGAKELMAVLIKKCAEKEIKFQKINGEPYHCKSDSDRSFSGISTYLKKYQKNNDEIEKGR